MAVAVAGTDPSKPGGPAGSTKTPWGNADNLFKPPQEVASDTWWLSVLLFWLLLPINLTMALVASFSDGFLRWLAGMAMKSCEMGRPFCMAWVWWWYMPAGAVRLALAGSSRFNFFRESQQAFGGKDWWWHGEGAWGWRYESVRATMESDQKRGRAFGAVRAACPEIFPAEKFLLFDDGSRWAAFRAVFEQRLFARSNWAPRLPLLVEVLAPLMPATMSAAAVTKPQMDKMVATAIWFLLFDVKLTDAQATTVASWGGSGLAGYFVFPRLIHRIAFNALQRKVVELRKDTLAVFTAHKLEPLADELNAALPPEYRVTELCQLADVLVFAACFAGVGGTQHGSWAVTQFLMGKTVDVKQETVAFPPSDKLAALYKADPAKFIMETVRLDCPVTSATCVFKEDQLLPFSTSCCCGGVTPQAIPKDSLHQYVLSMANRDSSKWGPTANDFDPSRKDLTDLLTWNGALSNRAAAPRICPGQELSMEVMTAITGTLAEVLSAPASQ